MFKSIADYLSFSEEKPRTLDDLSEKQLFFIWLYTPHNFLTTDKVIQHALEFDIPIHIIIRKLITQLYVSGIDNENIISILSKKFDLIDFDETKMKKLLSECKKSYKHPIPDSDTIEQILKFYKKYDDTKHKNNTDNLYHTGLPHPDKYKGRPKIEWHECYHIGCHKKFGDSETLITHLAQNQKMDHWFHSFHQKYVELHNLTPEKVMSEKLTSCPAWVCVKKHKNTNMTPKEVCDHFRSLGIEPFWLPGDDCMDLKHIFVNDEIKPKAENIYTKTFSEATCIICFDKKPQVLFQPCHHHFACFTCAEKLNTCPYCKAVVKYRLPF
jgi:hypothetical protein